MENTNDFLPTDYKAPAGKYMKFKEGENRFRVMSSAITGFEYWNTDNSPVRSKTPFTETPGIKKDGGKSKISHFWAFVVWNYQEDAINVLELTQRGIQGFIKGLVDDKDWGDPKNYDIIVNREGSGLDTEYVVRSSPHKEISEEMKTANRETKINLSKLYTGEDPFMADEKKVEDDNPLKDIPFNS